MDVHLNWKWALWGFFALVALIVLVDTAEDVLHDISYPFSTWRMDLDDATANVLTAIGILVAYTVGRRKQKKDRDTIEAKLNGELRELAQEILLDQIETSGINDTVTSLRADVEEVKQQRDECMGKIDALTAALKGDG
jgi:cobalamin biosynthesis Mg chelatase CobN